LQGVYASQGAGETFLKADFAHWLKGLMLQISASGGWPAKERAAGLQKKDGRIANRLLRSASCFNPPDEA
jgi:hypothetical protein